MSDDEDLEEHEELEDDETFDDDDDDFSFHQDDEEENEDEQENDEDHDDEEEDHDEDDENEDHDEDEEEDAAEEYDEDEKAPPITKTVSPQGPINVEDLPVPLVIEIGRIQISVQKLLELQSGNILELNVQPENGVSLVINGHCVGKGELHHLGKTLGVRIIELG